MTLKPYSPGDENPLAKIPMNKGDQPTKKSDENLAPPPTQYKKGTTPRAVQTPANESQERTHHSVGNLFRRLKTGKVTDAKSTPIGLNHMHTYTSVGGDTEQEDTANILDDDVAMSEDPNQQNTTSASPVKAADSSTTEKKEGKGAGKLGRFTSLFKKSTAGDAEAAVQATATTKSKEHSSKTSEPLVFESVLRFAEQENRSEMDENDATVSGEEIAESSPIEMDESKRTELAMEKQANGGFVARGKGAGEWPIVVVFTPKGKDTVFEVKLQKSKNDLKAVKMSLLGKPAMLKVLFDPAKDVETLHDLHAVLLLLKDQAGSLPQKEREELSKALEAIREYVKGK